MSEPKRPMMNVVAVTDVQALLAYFAKNTYRPREGDAIASEAMEKCIELFKSDYNVTLINNAGGELSSHYPSQLIISEYELNQNSAPATTNPSQRTTNTIYENLVDESKLKDLILKARSARCRARFPMPTILYKGKYICRSGTLSGGPEIYGRSGYDYLFNTSEPCDNDEVDESLSQVSQSDWQLFDRVRNSDIKLLKALNVGTIVDFMVEKKKVKFGMNVTSSEKVDKENRYSEFALVSLPYPGCEFFKEYREKNYVAEGLKFDWNQAYVDASIFVPDDPISGQLKINWASYTDWDLETITMNYLKLLLRYLQDGNSGLLIHCISGWDRTPLFVSLLRLSLWADGLIHQSLDAQQMLYLTIAYDWMLFGHHLPDRLVKGEEIFFFCFNVLKKIIGEEFSMQGLGRFKSKTERATEKPAEKSAVIRTDSEPLLDPILLEPDNRGSNVSLNSSCSSVSNKSQDVMSWSLHVDEFMQLGDGQNGNQSLNVQEACTSAARSPQGRRTSPVSVPASKIRQRHESSSSIGSWQLITGSGSIRDSEASETSLNANECAGSQDSSHTMIDEDTVMNLNMEEYGYRKIRLLKVRELFLSNYHTTIGFKFLTGDSTLSGMLGNFAEKVGLSGRP